MVATGCVGHEVATLTTDFSNVLTKSQIEEMATADELEVVKEVQVSDLKAQQLTSRSTLPTTWRTTQACSP